MQGFTPVTLQLNDKSNLPASARPQRLFPRDIGPRDYLSIRDLRVWFDGDSTGSEGILMDWIVVGFGDMVREGGDPFHLDLNWDFRPGILLRAEFVPARHQVFGVDGEGGFGQPLGLNFDSSGNHGQYLNVSYAYKLIQG